MKTNLLSSTQVASDLKQQLQPLFIARGMASRDEARHIGEYYPAEDVLQELDDMLIREITA